MSQFQPSKALEAIFMALAEVNSYLASTEPWKETDPASLLKILSYSIEGLRRTSILLQPFIPDSASALLDRLAVSKEDREWRHTAQWIDAENVTRLLKHIQAGGVSGPVFVALQDEKVEKLNASKIKQIKVKKDRRA
jgi:methionyl-tRNA synthetase